MLQTQTRDPIENDQLKQGVEKLHEIAGVELDYTEWTELNDIVENGYFDTVEEILDGLNEDDIKQNGYSNYELEFDAKKNIITHDISNGEQRLTDYIAIIRTHKNTDKVTSIELSMKN